MVLKDILSDNEISKLTQFSPAEITWLEKRMFSGTNEEGKTVAKVQCVVRERIFFRRRGKIFRIV